MTHRIYSYLGTAYCQCGEAFPGVDVDPAELYAHLGRPTSVAGLALPPAREGHPTLF